MESRRCISRTLAATALAGVLGAAPAWAEPRSYTIDPDHFAIGFQIDHLGYADVIGMFLKGSGSFVISQFAPPSSVRYSQLDLS